MPTAAVGTMALGTPVTEQSEAVSYRQLLRGMIIKSFFSLKEKNSPGASGL